MRVGFFFFLYSTSIRPWIEGCFVVVLLLQYVKQEVIITKKGLHNNWVLFQISENKWLIGYNPILKANGKDWVIKKRHRIYFIF